MGEFCSMVRLIASRPHEILTAGAIMRLVTIPLPQAQREHYVFLPCVLLLMMMSTGQHPLPALLIADLRQLPLLLEIGQVRLTPRAQDLWGSRVESQALRTLLFVRLSYRAYP